jgi:ABC-type transport system involved in multi-copper enzyme maturation permease subunit
VLAVLLLGGTGVRTDLVPGHPSLYYTLTLPVSRFALIWSRFAIALAATVALFAGLLAAALVALLMTGQAASVGEIVKSSLLIGLFAVALQTVVGLLIPMWDDRLGPWAFVIVFVVVILSVGAYFNEDTEAWPWLAPLMAFIASPPAPWNVLGGAVLIVALSLSIAALMVRKKDF